MLHTVLQCSVCCVLCNVDHCDIEKHKEIPNNSMEYNRRFSMNCFFFFVFLLWKTSWHLTACCRTRLTARITSENRSVSNVQQKRREKQNTQYMALLLLINCYGINFVNISQQQQKSSKSFNTLWRYSRSTTMV